MASDIKQVAEESLADSGLREKDLENLISQRLEQLVRIDQLMVIMQERSRQEEPDILAIDESGSLFTCNPDAYKEMISERKGAAYYDRKFAIENIRAGNAVCLYHTGVGVIGIGKARTDYQTKDIGLDENAEYFIPVDFEYLVDIVKEGWSGDAVRAWQINKEFGTSHRFRQTVFRLPSEIAEFIRNEFKKKGVQRG